MSNGDYTDRQYQRDREYAEAWKKLSARERKELQKAGITGPQMPTYKTGKADCEAIIQNQADDSASFDLLDLQPENTHRDDAEIVRRIVAELMAHPNIRLTVDCMAVASEISYDGQSMVQIAKRYGVGRAAVSKRCIAISNSLALPLSRAMRKLTTRQTYADNAKQQHRRNSH